MESGTPQREYECSLGLVCYLEVHTFGDVKPHLPFVGPCL